MFNRIGLAITFSPNSTALLKATFRLQKLFNSKIFFIHIGIKNSETEKRLIHHIESVGFLKNDYEIIWDRGNPASSIIKNCEKHSFDLLISGALEKEKSFKFFFGSIARRIMRESPSTTLILKNPSIEPKSIKKFYINADYSTESEKVLISAYNFARAENADEFVIIRDFYAPVLTTSIIDLGAMKDVEKLKTQWINEEKEKMSLFVKELNLTDINPKIVCLYGKNGWEAGNYARKNNADLFIVSHPTEKNNFLSRLFLHSAEYSFEKLPSDLLIIR